MASRAGVPSHFESAAVLTQADRKGFLLSGEQAAANCFGLDQSDTVVCGRVFPPDGVRKSITALAKASGSSSAG